MRKGIALIGGAAVLLAVAQFAVASPLLHYTFDESASGNAAAADTGAAPAAPGSFEGGAVRTGTTPGGYSLGAADLSAASTYVTTPDADKLDGLGAMTLTAWINLRAAPANGNRIFSKQVASGNFDGFSFAMSNPSAGASAMAADNFRLNLALGGTGGFGFFVSNDMGADNEWVFVAVTYDGSSAVNFYTGDEAGAVGGLGGGLLAGAGAPGTLVGNDRDFRVGAQSEGTTSASIWIDDVRVYGSVLSQAELDGVRLANVPEPATLGLLGVGLTVALVRRRRA